MVKVYLAEKFASTEVWCRIIDWDFTADRMQVEVIDETGLRTIKKGERLDIPMGLVREHLDGSIH